MSSKKSILILGNNIDSHILKVFNLMIDYYKWDFFVISWNSKNFINNDLLIKYFDLDKILNLEYKILPFFNNKEYIMTYFEKVRPKLLVFVGDFDSKLLKDIPNNPISKILIGSIFNNKIIFKKIIKDSLIYKITNTHIDYIPKPNINYQDFLDFDTSESLKIKQDNNLILYQDGIISKQKVIAFITSSKNTLLFKNLINSEGYKYTNLKDIKDSEILIPEITEENAPIIFEVIDMLIIDHNIDDQIIKYMLWSIASGTILILPRKEEFIGFIGNGAIYYKENSTSELKACLQVLETNHKKIKEIRDNSAYVLQKKFSYKSIARSWEYVFQKFIY